MSPVSTKLDQQSLQTSEKFKILTTDYLNLRSTGILVRIRVHSAKSFSTSRKNFLSTRLLTASRLHKLLVAFDLAHQRVHLRIPLTCLCSIYTITQHLVFIMLKLFTAYFIFPVVLQFICCYSFRYFVSLSPQNLIVFALSRIIMSSSYLADFALSLTTVASPSNAASIFQACLVLQSTSQGLSPPLSAICFIRASSYFIISCQNSICLLCMMAPMTLPTVSMINRINPPIIAYLNATAAPPLIANKPPVMNPAATAFLPSSF